MNSNQKILLTFIEPILDISDIVIPPGNYYFKIRATIENNVIGILSSKDMSIKCVFKYRQIIEGMGAAQSWLVRRTSLSRDENLPDIPSPRDCSSLPLCCFRKNAVSSYQITNTCSICLEECKTSTKQLTCGHVFHKKCINKWLNKKKTCPLCREKIRK